MTTEQKNLIVDLAATDARSKLVLAELNGVFDDMDNERASKLKDAIVNFAEIGARVAINEIERLFKAA